MKSLKHIILGGLVLLAGLLAASCQKEEYGKPIEARLDIADRIEVPAAGGLVTIPLVSTYPWYASTNAGWIKMVKFRGQMKLQEKIVINVDKNPSAEIRESGLQIRLMDQLTVDIIISQKGADPLPEIN